MAGDNITQFTSPVDSLRPTEVGIEATTQAAQRANRMFTETGSAVEQTGRQVGHDIGSGIEAAGDAAVASMDHHEIARGAAAEAQLLDVIGKQWDDKVKGASPQSTTTAEDFMRNTLEPELQNFTQGFTTSNSQKWAESRVAELRNHFNTKTAADMTEKAKDAVSQDLEVLGNSSSNAASRNPGDVPSILGMLKKNIGVTVGSSPNIRGEDSFKITTELTQKLSERAVKAGMTTAILQSKDPVGTAQWWTKQYPQYINGAEAVTASKQAESMLKVNAAADRAAAVAEKQAQTMDFQKKGAELATSLINPDGTIKTAGPEFMQQAKALSLHPGADFANMKAMFEFGKVNGPDAEVKQQKADFNKAATDLITSAIQPDGTIKTGPEFNKGIADLEKTHKGADRADVEALINFGKAKLPEVSNPAVLEDIKQKQIDRTLTTMDLVKAANSGGLSTEDYKFQEAQHKAIQEEDDRTEKRAEEADDGQDRPRPD